MYRIFRWFLVVLLPFVGFWVGSRLTPELQPIWQTSFTNVTVFLGLVDEGRTALLMERHSPDLYDYALEAIIGIDTANGKELFRSPLPDDLRNKANLTTRAGQLSQNGEIVILIDTKKREVLLFDRKKQEITQRFVCETSEPSLSISSAALRGTTLIVNGYTMGMGVDNALYSKAFVTIWDIASTTPKYSIKDGDESHVLDVSDDGKLAHVDTLTKGVHSHAIIDTSTGESIYKVDANLPNVKWSADYQLMYALRRENDNVFLDTYQRDGKQFKLLGSILNPSIGGNPPNSVGPWLTTTQRTRYNLIHFLIEDYLGKGTVALVNGIWPPDIMRSVYAARTSEMVRSLTLPDDLTMLSMGIDFVPDAKLQGVFLPRHHSLTYWHFTNVSIWPKWLGFFVGLVLAAMLARQNLRLRSRVAGAPASVLQK